jgi:hypothetical protein
LFQVAFNDSRLNQAQLAINVGMNSFEYFLTTQLGASTRFPSLAEKRLNRVVTVVKFANYMFSSRCGGLAVLKTGKSTLNTIRKPLLFQYSYNDHRFAEPRH